MCQQTIGEWGYYFPLWKLLSKEICHVNIANICLLTTLSLVSRSVASSSSAIALTSIWQPFAFNLNRTDWSYKTQGIEGLMAKAMDGQHVMEKDPTQLIHEGFPQRGQAWEAEGRGEGGADNGGNGEGGLKTLRGRRYRNSSEFKKCSVICTTYNMNILSDFEEVNIISDLLKIQILVND